jgi:CO/xanthine dehydrogenase FAD-binding subunit
MTRGRPRGGICGDARIVLGAVAPESVKIRATEDLIKGHAVGEEVATESAQVAVQGAIPLTMRDYYEGPAEEGDPGV